MKTFISILFVISGTVINGDPCVTPDGSDGNCIQLSQCPPLIEALQMIKISPQNAELLRNSSCGFEGNIPKVCCPYMCLAYNGEQGQCVDRKSCPKLCENCEEKICLGTDSICCPLSTPDSLQYNCLSKVSSFPPNQKSHCCGIDSGANDKIVAGGIEAKITDYPWLAIIEYQQGERIRMLCGGALISGKYVVTAAHCVVGKILEIGTPVSVRLGEHDTTTKIDCRPMFTGLSDCNDEAISIPIEKIISHPEYSNTTRKNDIALLRMKEFAPFTDFIRPICLPTLDNTMNYPGHLRLYVAGWGKINSTHLQSPFKIHVQLPYVDQKTCQKAYSIPNRNASFWEGRLCAGGEIGKDSCKDDSGGPLMFNRVGTFELVGVTSFSSVCSIQDVPAVYTKVYEYTDWIYSNIVP